MLPHGIVPYMTATKCQNLYYPERYRDLRQRYSVSVSSLILDSQLLRQIQADRASNQAHPYLKIFKRTDMFRAYDFPQGFRSLAGVDEETRCVSHRMVLQRVSRFR